MKKILSALLSFLILFTGVSVQAESTPTSQTANGQTTQSKGENMEKTANEYYNFLNNLSLFPINFVYNDVYYHGFHPAYFTEESREVRQERNGLITVITLSFGDLKVKIESGFYADYSAYDYTVYFTNEGNENSGVLRKMNAVDMTFVGSQPHLKGIYGDYDYQYTPYDKDLTKEDVNFTSTRGRASHTYFPYFNLETKNGGAILAIGWGGTWQADFKYDETKNATRFTGTGVVDFCSYLKPGETVRTPLIGVVRYYDQDEDTAMNMWRRWVVDCNYPRNAVDSKESVQPFSTIYVAFDMDNPNKFRTDGSTAEDYTTWRNSMDAFYSHGIKLDFEWFDAGWYSDPYGRTVEFDWWGNVGTWELDPVKWPGDTFKERVQHAHDNGSKFLMWFEPERVTHLDGMVQNYGYKREWVLSDHGDNNCYINNLGNKQCLAWTFNRIINVLDKYDIDLYREDFNIDPGIFWSIGDGYEGKNRVGITENLYMQGHYALWEGIIEYCKQNNKCPFVDSCASGGGRNDLQTMRYGVPLNRSDSDRFLTVTRLSMTNRVCSWIPFNGTVAKDSATLTDNRVDIYTLRASYMAIYNPQANYYLERDTIDWDLYRQGMNEFNQMKKYLLKDFYALTPDHSTSDDTKWTAYEFFDEKTDSGLIQAFRQTECPDKTLTIYPKGLKENGYYSVRDVDGNLSIAKIRGGALMKGFKLTAASARTSIMLYIEPYNA